MRSRAAAVLAVALVGSPLVARAQTVGRVSGRILDQTGAVLPGVAIDLVVQAVELTTTTDGEGRYALDNVPSGRAELTYRLLDFSVVKRTVTVAAGASVTADVVLTLSLNADVVVTGTRTFRNIADLENPAENLVGSDIDYYYASRLPGEPAEGLQDIHTHPAVPRSARFGLHVAF